MLIKGNDVLKLKLVSLRDGKEIDTITDLIYDPTSHRLLALLVDEGGWFSEAKVVKFEDVRNIGKDAVMVESEDVIRRASEISERVANIAKQDTYLTKTKIITEDGTELGTVSDIYFDSETGEVRELEVSQGLGNIRGGKKRVRTEDIITIGEDSTIVSTYAEADIEQQEQERIDTAKQKATGVVDTAKEKVNEAGQKIREKVDETRSDPRTQGAIDETKDTLQQVGDTIKEKVSEAREALDESRKKEALGKYLTINILSPTDEIIGKRGEMITNELLEKAEQFGILDKVVGNTTKEPPVV